MYAMPGSTVIPYKGQQPTLHTGVFLATGAHIIGDVTLAEDVSVWFNTVIRGDCHYVTVGARTNIQDGAVIHVTQGEAPTIIGSDVTIGHGAVIHGCTIKDMSLIGMGAIILDGAVIQEESLVAAGSLVPPGKTYPPRSLIKGSPAKVARSLTDQEVLELKESVAHYLDYKSNYVPSSATETNL